ncbi:MAG: NAD-dependent dehydratase [Melioribacteraceae bacterium]|nr:MAG: NAD-dependent dehydratase [Melioribacteraceae bacterium]
MNIGITGSGGFIGRNLSNLLENSGYKVFGFDKSEGVDISKPGFVPSNIKLDVIIHLAANTFIPDSFNNPFNFFKNNIDTTLSVLEYCRINRCKIVFSSTYLYGQPEHLPIDENHPVLPHSPYTQSKKTSEDLILSYSRDFGVESIILRLFNLYGKGQKGSFLIPTILEQINQKNVRLKDPRPRRDFINVIDVCEAFKAAIENSFKQPEIFNIGFGKSYSISELIEIINQNLGEKINVEFSNEQRPNEIMDVVANTSKAKKMLSWEPKISLEEGMRIILG